MTLEDIGAVKGAAADGARETLRRVSMVVATRGAPGLGAL